MDLGRDCYADLLIIAKKTFIARWNAARVAKLAAYRASDAVWRAAIEASADQRTATERRRRALVGADAIEAADIHAARLRYAQVRASVETIFASGAGAALTAASLKVGQPKGHTGLPPATTTRRK